MSDYSKIGLNQLDVEGIADYVVESKNLVYRNNEIDSSSTKAMDVDKVAGINAGVIAVAVSEDDRNTVDNANKLGGVPASEYVTQTTGASIIKNQVSMKQAYGEELQELKEELYLLKNELAKNGAISARGLHNGFFDLHRRKEYVNLQDKLGDVDTTTVSDLNKIHVDDADLYNSLDVNDFICLVNEETKTFDIKEIIEKTDATRVVTLDSDLNVNVRAAEMSLYKSKGIIHDGKYVFANEADNQLSDEEYHTGLSDDTYNVIKRINESNKGFGYSFRIPEAKQGFVTNFEVCAKATGNPGSLICYIIDSRDLDKFINPNQAAQDYQDTVDNEKEDGFKFFAKSQPYKLESAVGKRYIKFNFLQENGSYPLMSLDSNGNTVRYIAIIEATEADQSNYVELVFLQHKNADGQLGDLELNNTTYYYNKQSDSSITPALTTDDELNKTDLYYQITTRGIVENEPEAQKQGLYTARFNFIDPVYKCNGKTARLTLRVLREGKFNTITDSTDLKSYFGNPLTIETGDKDNEIKVISDLNLKTDIYKRVKTRSKDTEISEAVPVIIGNNITRVQGINDTSITSNDALLVKNKDKVYRCAYLASIKARTISMDDKGVISTSDYDNYILPLVAVRKDYNFDGTKTDATDQLIFQADLVGKDLAVKNYNDFELQIYWENKNLSTYSDIKRDQMGGIIDLTFSLCKGF